MEKKFRSDDFRFVGAVIVKGAAAFIATAPFVTLPEEPNKDSYDEDSLKRR